MKITLEYVATLAISSPLSGTEMDVPPGITVSALLDHLGIASFHQPVIVPFINEEKKRRETILQPGDHVFLAMPVGGG